MTSVPLLDVAQLDYGFAFDSKQFNTDGRGLPLVRIRDVLPGHSGTYYAGEYADRFIVNNGDYLIGMDGQFNLARWQGGKALLNQRVCRIGALDDSLDRNYLMRFLPIALRSIEDATPFVTVKHLSAKALSTIEVPLLPLAQQRRIAEILDRADAIRNKRLQALGHVNALVQSIFDEMFGTAPWTSTMGDAVDVQIGPFGSLLHQEDYAAGGVPLINPMHIRNGRLKPDPEFATTEAKAMSLANYRLRRGDVVLGRRGEMGRAGIAFAEHEGMLCGTGSLILRPREISTVFLHAAVTSPRMKAHFERTSLGATMPNLNASLVKSAPIPLVSSDDQEEFATRVERTNRQRDALARHVAAANELFASLQSRAFRGEL